MQLDPQTWLPQSEGLPLGRRKRVDHVCGPGRTLLITHDAKGIHAYCFRCNAVGFSRPPAPSLEELVRRNAARTQADAVLRDVRGVAPDGNADVVSWPERARIWFYRAGLSNTDIATLKATFDPESYRVILPLPEGYWLARSIDGRAPKYLGPPQKPSDLLVSYGKSTSGIILTEDALSAYKVGKISEAWPILGTKVSDKYTAELLSRDLPVWLWLDPDAAGQRAANKYMRQLSAYGLRVFNIVAAKDPKLLFYEDIQSELNKAGVVPEVLGAIQVQ